MPRDTRFHEADASDWILKADDGKGACYVCREPFRVGQRIVYETPDDARRRWLLKVVRHARCTDPVGPGS